MADGFRTVKLESNNNEISHSNPLPVNNGLIIPNYTSYSVDLTDPNNITITYSKNSVTIATETISITPTEITDEVTT